MRNTTGQADPSCRYPAAIDELSQATPSHRDAASSPKCQSGAAKRWLELRRADLLPVEYYHVVFTLPTPIADIAYQNTPDAEG